MNEQNGPKPKRNWWKYSFFALLLVAEVMRETIVLMSGGSAEPNASKSISNYNGYVNATGRWWRVNGESEIVPGTVTIDCNPQTRDCVEASVTVHDRTYVWAPQVDRFSAKWDDTAVTYVNDSPDCARYSVRIDWVDKRASATRTRKANPLNPNCAMLEEKLEMELGDSYKIEESRKRFDEHWVPIFQLFRWIGD